jgi:hypothetical protein
MTKPSSAPDLIAESSVTAVEPLLPIEKKLIGWSVGIGIVLLIVLIAINYVFPIRV